LVPFGNRPESLDTTDRAVDGVAGEPAFAQRFVAQPDYVSFARNDGERLTVGSVSHRQFDGV
jgi:hypothetical protein